MIVFFIFFPTQQVLWKVFLEYQRLPTGLAIHQNTETSFLYDILMALMCPLPALQKYLHIPSVYASIFSWHNWAIRVTLMHHIYLLFITGRICPDWPRIFLWQLFSQRLFQSILEFSVFPLSLIHPKKDKEGRDFHSAIFKHSRAHLQTVSSWRRMGNSLWAQCRTYHVQTWPRLVWLLLIISFSDFILTRWF